MKSNPITHHLSRDHHPPSMLGAGLIALGLCVISLVGFALSVEVIVQSSVFAAWMLTLINPLATAVLSSLLTWQTTGSKQYQLLKLAPLSPNQIRQGFVRAALFRSRVQFAVQLGLLPVWVAEIFSGWQAIAAFYSAAPPENPNIAAPLIVITLMGIGAFGFNLVAAVFGARQGLRPGHLTRGIVVSLGNVLIVAVLCYIPTLTLLGPVMGTLGWDMETSLYAIGIVFGCLVLPPYGLALLLYWPFKKKQRGN